jgi:two-component sensor histidine kinase
MRRTMVVNCAPVSDESGRTIAAVAGIYDITERKVALDRQKLLLDEINHRAKNAMATVQSIARLTARSATSLQEYVASFESRLAALSEAYNLLGRYRWQGAHIKDLVEATLEAHLAGDRIVARGQNLYLRPRAALALTSAFNELATNSVKYGALSAANGRVDLTWSLDDAHKAVLQWAESGGPAVTPPSRRGFGTRFLEQGLAIELQGAVELDFAATGLTCRIAFPLS